MCALCKSKKDGFRSVKHTILSCSASDI